MTRVTGDDGTLRVEFEAPVGAGSVEVWSAETVDDETWTRLDGSPVRNATTGLLELRMPVDPHRPQQFYRLVIHSEPVSSRAPLRATPRSADLRVCGTGFHLSDRRHRLRSRPCDLLPV